MMSKYFLPGLLMLAALTTGCSTLNESECVTADWQAIGYEDGSRGYESSRFGKHRKSCAKHGITAGFDRYIQGYDAGVRIYCTPERGYQLGKDNRPISYICPEDLFFSVRQGYGLGQDIYLKKLQLRDEINFLKENVKAIDDEMDALNRELEEHYSYLTLAEEGLSNKDSKPSERLIYFTQREAIKKLVDNKSLELDSLEASRNAHSHSIEELRDEIRFLDQQPMPLLR